MRPANNPMWDERRFPVDRDVLASPWGNIGMRKRYLGTGASWPSPGVAVSRRTFVAGTGAAAIGAGAVLPLPALVSPAAPALARKRVRHRDDVGVIINRGNPISRVTVGALEDMGYVVGYDAAETYVVPAPTAASERYGDALCCVIERPAFEIIADQ